MPIHMKRWCDRSAKDDGYRLLICRSRPRGVVKEKEKWDGWCSELSPSAKLDADFRSDTPLRITWDDYRRRYLEEMKPHDDLIDELARLGSEGKTITLLCSKACKDEPHCHRTLLKTLIEKRMERIRTSSSAPTVALLDH